MNGRHILVRKKLLGLQVMVSLCIVVLTGNQTLFLVEHKHRNNGRRWDLEPNKAQPVNNKKASASVQRTQHRCYQGVS